MENKPLQYWVLSVEQPFTSLNDNGHEVRLWGNIQGQIDEINNNFATNQRYFKDTLLAITVSYD